MLGPAGLRPVFEVNQLSVEQNEYGTISLIIVKIVDGLLVAGTDNTTSRFMQPIQKEFEIGNICIGSKLSFAGCEIEQD